MISGLSIGQNLIYNGYPVLESFLSIEPFIEEYIIVLGPSFDGTKELLQMMAERWNKIRIIERDWEPSYGGTTWNAMTNVGKDECREPWILYVQPDEVWHKEGLEELIQDIPIRGGGEGIVVPMLDIGQNFQTIRKDDGMNRVVQNLPHIRSYSDSIGFTCGNAKTINLQKPPVNLGWVFPVNSLRKIVSSRKYHEMGQDTQLSLQAKRDMIFYQTDEWDYYYNFCQHRSPIIDKIPPILHDLIGAPEYYVRGRLLFEDGKLPEPSLTLPDFYPVLR